MPYIIEEYIGLYLMWINFQINKHIVYLYI